MKNTVPLTPEQIDTEISTLHAAVDDFAAVMRVRLAIMVCEENRTGWNDPANAEEYYKKLLAHAAGVPLAAGQEIDIANFAMFLWQQRKTARINGGQS